MLESKLNSGMMEPKVGSNFTGIKVSMRLMPLCMLGEKGSKIHTINWSEPVEKAELHRPMFYSFLKGLLGTEGTFPSRTHLPRMADRKTDHI